MGRAKLNMELINKEKSRNTTFKKRKEGLVRKMHEFTTLCDVSACMIIYGPKQDGSSSSISSSSTVNPEIWPQDVEEFRRVFDIYRSKKKDSGTKTFGLSDFFQDRKKRIEEDLVKLRKKNMEAKYPTWLEQMEFLTQLQLRELVVKLSDKAEQVRSRIENLKMRSNLIDFANLSQPNQFPHLPFHYPADHNHHQEMSQNTMLRLFMNDNDHSVQYGGSGMLPGESIQSASFKSQVIYDWPNARTAQYYPAMPPPMMPRHFMPYSVMQGMAMQMQPAFKTENRQEGDGAQEEVFP